MFIISPFSHPPGTMLSAIQRIGLLDSLVLTLDAGDIASYDGSSQTWTDVSGNGNHFYRGTGSGSDAADPTFSGVAGRQSSAEFFASGGGDYFVATGAQSFNSSWHKDGATFTIASWGWVPVGAAQGPTLLRNFNAAGPGCTVVVGSLAGNGEVIVGQDNVSAVTLFSRAGSDTIVEGQWLFVAASWSEGSGTSFVRENDSSGLFETDTYVSPSASAPETSNVIWASLDASTQPPPDSGTRINSLMAWDRALSQAEVTALYDATKAKFGL